MNSRAEGNVNTLEKQAIISQVNEWYANGEIEEIYEEADKSICYFAEWDLSGRDFTLHYPDTDKAENILSRIIADDKAKELINLNALAEFLYNHIDVNSLMVLDNLVLVCDENPDEISKARKELESITGDEYAFEICSDELGITWVERQSVVINISNLIESSEEISKELENDLSSDAIFREGFVQTLCHECRHLFYECNEIIQIGEGTPYPALGGVENAVEEYGNSEAERLFHDKEARKLIDQMYLPENVKGKTDITKGMNNMNTANYMVFTEYYEGYEGGFLGSYTEAINVAKEEVKSGHENVFVGDMRNDLTVWDSHDDPALRVYEEYSHDEWISLAEGHHAQSYKPSVYFDIDGTLGKWYSDGRGFAMEELLDPANHYFRDIEPHEVMIDLAEQLHSKGVDVCIISAADKDTIRDKWDWIEEHLPFVPKENICFSPLGADKSEFVKGNSEISILIDDYNNNLEEWRGTAIKAINTVNSHQDKFAEIDFTRHEAMLESAKNNLDIDENALMNNAYAIAKSVESVAEKITEILDGLYEKGMQKENTDGLLSKYSEVGILDMCEELAKNDSTSHLVSWFGDCAVYEPAMGVTGDEILKAYDNLMENRAALYETYKKEWVQEHIDDITMTDTQSLYENSEDAMEMTFNEYVEEYGFSDGSCYAGYDEFCANELATYELADTIEQFMFERGEYEFSDDDTIRWVDKNSREETAKNIRLALENEDVSALIEYFKDEQAVIDMEDEMFNLAEKLEKTLERSYSSEKDDKQASKQTSDSKETKKKPDKGVERD